MTVSVHDYFKYHFQFSYGFRMTPMCVCDTLVHVFIARMLYTHGARCDSRLSTWKWIRLHCLPNRNWWRNIACVCVCMFVSVSLYRTLSLSVSFSLVLFLFAFNSVCSVPLRLIKFYSLEIKTSAAVENTANNIGILSVSPTWTLGRDVFSGIDARCEHSVVILYAVGIYTVPLVSFAIASC